MTETTLQQVQAALAARGWKGTIEYPGYIMIDCLDGAVWNCGTANETWGATFERHGICKGSFETAFTPHTGTVEQIADALVAGMTSANYED